MDITYFPPRPASDFRYSRQFKGYGVDASGTVYSCLKGGNQASNPARRFKKKWIPLKPADNGHGYMSVGLVSERNRKLTKYVHRIVLEHFVGPCPSGQECRHLDGNTKNNAKTNLAWGTILENKADQVRHGTVMVGTKNPRAKLTEADIPTIRLLSAQGMKRSDVAKRFGVSPMTIQFIVDGRTWKHVTPPSECRQKEVL